MLYVFIKWRESWVWSIRHRLHLRLCPNVPPFPPQKYIPVWPKIYHNNHKQINTNWKIEQIICTRWTLFKILKKVCTTKRYQEQLGENFRNQKITGLRTLGEWISHRYIMKQLKHKWRCHDCCYNCYVILICNYTSVK